MQMSIEDSNVPQNAKNNTSQDLVGDIQSISNLSNLNGILTYTENIAIKENPYLSNKVNQLVKSFRLVLRDPQTNEDTEVELIGSFVYRNWQVFIFDILPSAMALSAILLAYLEKFVIETPISNLAPGKTVFAIFLHDSEAGNQQSECATIFDFPLSDLEPLKFPTQGEENASMPGDTHKTNENKQKKRKTVYEHDSPSKFRRVSCTNADNVFLYEDDDNRKYEQQPSPYNIEEIV